MSGVGGATSATTSTSIRNTGLNTITSSQTSDTGRAHYLTRQLLQALDSDYNVVDAHAVESVLGILENFVITKELLETTRLGKHVNELRRKTDDPDLARRTKLLVKRWRDLVIPEKTGAQNNGSLPPPKPISHQKRQPLTSPTVYNVSPGLRSASPGVFPSHRKSSSDKTSVPDTKRFSPLDISASSPHPVHEIIKIGNDPYDSDSQDVIFVDDVEDLSVEPPSIGSIPLFESHAVKRAHSPYNGGSLLSDSDSLRRISKKAKRESSGKKAKKRRNEKSENSVVDHSLEVKIQSPFMPISSASTSPNVMASNVMKNGLSQTVLSPSDSISLLDDLDSKSPAPVIEHRNKSRKNGCKKPSIDIEEYSTFIKNKLPTSGKKVKTTQELLKEIQARKAGNVVSPVKVRDSVPKEDFLTVYDSKKQIKAEAVITDIIELNDSNSFSGKEEESAPLPSTNVISDTGENKDGNDPTKFESLEAILAKLPPFNKKNIIFEDDFLPVCTCTTTYKENDLENNPEEIPQNSIFGLDKRNENDNAVTVPAEPLFEQKIDPDCPAAEYYKRRLANGLVNQVSTLHNYYIPDVNGTMSQKKEEDRPICKVDEWAHQPYYDCEKDLFLNIVPKYNYLDYSSDRCIKNLSKIPLDKYEPAECISDAEWLENITRENREKFVLPIDSEFTSEQPSLEVPSENSGLIESTTNNKEQEEPISSDTKDNDKEKVDSEKYSDKNEDDSGKRDNEDGSENHEDEDDSYENEDEDEDYSYEHENEDESENKCDELESSMKDQSEPNETVEINRIVKKPKKIFTYEDSITLLPLSLSALNSSSPMSSDNNDLSCVFRTKHNQNYNSEYECLQSPKGERLTYDIIEDTTIVEMKDLTDGAVERLKVEKIKTDSLLGELNDNANCDSDIKRTDSCLETQSAFNNNKLESCVKGGCPKWVTSLTNKSFKEWHEPVVRLSLNDEPLTILPYVIID